MFDHFVGLALKGLIVVLVEQFECLSFCIILNKNQERDEANLGQFLKFPYKT